MPHLRDSFVVAKVGFLPFCGDHREHRAKPNTHHEVVAARAGRVSIFGIVTLSKVSQCLISPDNVRSSLLPKPPTAQEKCHEANRCLDPLPHRRHAANQSPNRYTTLRLDPRLAARKHRAQSYDTQLDPKWRRVAQLIPGDNIDVFERTKAGQISCQVVSVTGDTLTCQTWQFDSYAQAPTPGPRLVFPRSSIDTVWAEGPASQPHKTAAIVTTIAVTGGLVALAATKEGVFGVLSVAVLGGLGYAFVRLSMAITAPWNQPHNHIIRHVIYRAPHHKP